MTREEAGGDCLRKDDARGNFQSPEQPVVAEMLREFLAGHHGDRFGGTGPGHGTSRQAALEAGG